MNEYNAKNKCIINNVLKEVTGEVWFARNFASIIKLV